MTNRRTAGRQQHNNPRLPPPERLHDEQEVPQTAQKNFVGKFLAPKLKNEIVPLRTPPPPYGDETDPGPARPAGMGIEMHGFGARDGRTRDALEGGEAPPPPLQGAEPLSP